MDLIEIVSGLLTANRLMLERIFSLELDRAAHATKIQRLSNDLMDVTDKVYGY